MSQIPTAPPSGFRDFPPEATYQRARLIETVSEVYRRFGFAQIATPALEDLAVLLGKGGGENEKLIFKVMKRGEQLEKARAEGAELADMGLRFDLTLPLARFYSKNKGVLPHPFKAFNIGPVWRAERAQKGRYREFYQCDVDIIGADSVTAEIEVISAILAAFKAAGLKELPVAHVNDRESLLARLRAAGATDRTLGAACVAIDKLDKGVDVHGELSSLGVDPKILHEQPAVPERVKAVLDAVPGAVFAPTLVRGFDYYTSTVFEFKLPGVSGSVGGGGRYDRLTEKFGGQPVPAVGGSIGFERLLLLLEEPKAAGPRVVVTVFNDELRGASLKAAATLREAGIAADVYPGTAKLGNQLKYADARKAAYAVVIGPDEARAGQAKLKELATGGETTVALAELAQKV